MIRGNEYIVERTLRWMTENLIGDALLAPQDIHELGGTARQPMSTDQPKIIRSFGLQPAPVAAPR
jgi:hypothetical protein